MLHPNTLTLPDFAVVLKTKRILLVANSVGIIDYFPVLFAGVFMKHFVSAATQNTAADRRPHTADRRPQT
ncbi:MAG: hypothetical protein JST20_03060, partial [Bacteroidetes bacterium]|nr:hypothetical protein [Bacteroidota bacterium]